MVEVEPVLDLEKVEEDDDEENDPWMLHASKDEDVVHIDTNHPNYDVNSHSIDNPT